MGTKTYTSSSMSNLNSEGEEYRWERLSILEGAMAHHQHLMQGFHLQETQLGAHGTGFRNWIYWARNYKFSQYHDPDIGQDERTFNEMIAFFEPQVAVTPEMSPEQTEEFLNNHFSFDLEPEEIPLKQLKVCGITPSGKYKEVNLITVVRRVPKAKTIDSYQGSYEQDKLGQAYIWHDYDNLLKDSDYIKRFIASNCTQKAYQIVPGDGLAEADDEGNSTNVAGNRDDIWLQLGYDVTEPHVNEETGEDVNEVVFYEMETTLVPLKTEIQKLVPRFDAKSYFFAIWGFTYDSYQINGDLYQVNSDGCLLVTESGSPIPPEKEEETQAEGEEEKETNWITVSLYYKFTLEDWEKQIEEEYASEADVDTVKGFAYIDSLENAGKDPILGQVIDTDMKNIDSKMTPIICFRNDKSWLSEDPKDYWHLRNTKACKKVSSDKTYYSELLKSLKEQITEGDVAWVYLMYGVPCNYTQLHYGAHYALQFFKQLTIANWSSYKPGDTVNVTGRGRSYTYGSYNFNCRYNFSIGQTRYQCGTGKCPAPGLSDIRRGEVGSCYYAGGVTFWNQWDTDAWECITVGSYSARFSNIKNGKGSSPGGPDWFLPIWEIEGAKRQYSKCLIPFMWEIGQNIPYPDWTNLYQFAANIGATCYKVVKEKWYQTALFQFILIVVIIIIVVVVSYFCPPAGAAASKVGASIAATVGGSTAFWTAVVSIAISVAVSVVVNAIITPILQDLFGEVWGTILGAIVSIVASAAINGASSYSDIIDEFLNPMTWIQLANAAIQGLTLRVAKSYEALKKEFQEWIDYAEDKFTALYEAMAELGDDNSFWKARIRYGATHQAELEKSATGDPQQWIDQKFLFANNAEYINDTLENWADLKIQTKTVPAIAFGGLETNNSLA